MREFRRSGAVGLVGVVITAVIVAVIATSADATDPNPKKTMALIFGIIAAFIVIFFFVQGQIWSSTRSSMSSARLVTLLIFLTVPPIYLLDSFVPLLVGLPVILALVLWKAVALLTGRELDSAYSRVSRMMAPLGLEVTETPTLTIEPKYVAPVRMSPRLGRGRADALGGRYGRLVAGEGAPEVAVEALRSWMLDLWLAERLAGVLERVAPGLS